MPCARFMTARGISPYGLIEVMEMVTRVIFRKFSEGDIIALFPRIPGTLDYGSCAAYQHIGQHSSVDCQSVITYSKPAKPEEYRDLMEELVRIGYTELEVGKRCTYKDFQVRERQIVRMLDN